MERRPLVRVFIYFLCFTFFLMMGGFPRMMAEAKGNLPIGEMVSRGDVKCEARGNTWKSVESSNFSIFPGTRVKTEKGVAVLTLANNIQIDVGEKSLFSFAPEGHLVLTQGSVQFRIPATTEMSFKVGSISVVKFRTLQASTTPVPSKDEVAVGLISILPNGAVTVKSSQGGLSVVSQDRVVLAALSSKDSVTIPSSTVKGSTRTIVAQAYPEKPVVGGDEGQGGFWAWVGDNLVWVVAGVVVVGGGTALAVSGSGGDSGTDFVRRCP